MKLREKMKYAVMGFVICAMLSAGVMVMAANATQTVTREVTYGVRVSLNGQEIQFDQDSRPFTTGGRTFLPVRAIADAVGLAVDFDQNENTVHLGDRFAAEGRTRTLREAAPYFDMDRLVNGVPAWFFNSSTFHNSLNMGGAAHNDVLQFSSTLSMSGSTVFSLHNLNGDFSRLTGYLGRVDGSGIFDVTFNFIGDGTILQTYRLNATDMPIPVDVFVEGIRQLRIEMVVGEANFQADINYGFAGFLE